MRYRGFKSHDLHHKLKLSKFSRWIWGTCALTYTAGGSVNRTVFLEENLALRVNRLKILANSPLLQLQTLPS